MDGVARDECVVQEPKILQLRRTMFVGFQDIEQAPASNVGDVLIILSVNLLAR